MRADVGVVPAAVGGRPATSAHGARQVGGRRDDPARRPLSGSSSATCHVDRRLKRSPLVLPLRRPPRPRRRAPSRSIRDARRRAGSSPTVRPPTRPPRASSLGPASPAGAGLSTIRRTPAAPTESDVATTTAAPPALDPLDFLALDALLDDEERRSATPSGSSSASACLPEVGDWFEQGILPRELVPELAEARALRDAPRGLRPPRRERGRLRARLPRARGGRRRRPQRSSRCRARSRCTRSGAGAPRSRRSAGCPRCTRGEAIGCFGLTEPDAGSDPGAMRTTRAPRRLRLDPERREDVDHERHDRRRRGRLGAHRRRRDPRLPRREGDAGLHRAGDPQEDLAARLGHVRARPPGRPRPRPTRCSRRSRRCAGRSPASTRRATASSGAPSAPAAPASRRRSTTRRSGSSSASRSPPTSSPSRSSPRWRSRSTAPPSSRSTSAA